METDNPIRILFVEDLPSDTELAEREVQGEGIRFTSIRVETKEAFLKALEEFRPDLIISDYAMPAFDGMQALRLTKEYDPTIPFIVLTGSMNEETAVECMKAGATDYVIKERMKRLPYAIKEALEWKKVRQEKEAVLEALRESEEKYRQIVESLRDEYFFYRHDVKGVFQYVSPSLRNILGYSEEEFCRHFASYLTDNPVNREYIRHIDGSLRGEQQPPYPVEVYHKNGEVRTLSVTEMPVFGREGNVVAVSGIAHDITERKKAEAEIQNRVKELEDFYDMAVGRELKMIELKEEIAELKEELEKHKKDALNR
jgi:PAS domain S-box-containing protein